MLETPPDFLHAENQEEFDRIFSEFFDHYIRCGHSPEDIFEAIGPFWNNMKENIGGDEKAAKKLFQFRRMLAVNSIGVSWEVAEVNRRAREEGLLLVKHGYIDHIDLVDNTFEVSYRKTCNESHVVVEHYDYIINAIGRNIIKHALWDNLINDGLAKKHIGIGVDVSEIGQLIDGEGHASDLIYVVGMARAGDHMLRHGFLGNTAFNVPQIRAHLYPTMKAMLSELTALKSCRS